MEGETLVAMSQQKAEALYDFHPTADVELKIKVLSS